MPNPSDRPPTVRAFLGLIDYLLADPLTAPLAVAGQWSVKYTDSVGLVAHVPGDNPLAVLRKLESDLGGVFEPGNDVGTGLVWHELHTTRDGIPVKMTLAAPGDSEVERLRREVAELKAGRYREGQLAEQRHQVEDAAVPPVPVTA